MEFFVPGGGGEDTKQSRPFHSMPKIIGYWKQMFQTAHFVGQLWSTKKLMGDKNMF